VERRSSVSKTPPPPIPKSVKSPPSLPPPSLAEVVEPPPEIVGVFFDT